LPGKEKAARGQNDWPGYTTGAPEIIAVELMFIIAYGKSKYYKYIPILPSKSQ
jgi:hypothetical protein